MGADIRLTTAMAAQNRVAEIITNVTNNLQTIQNLTTDNVSLFPIVNTNTNNNNNNNNNMLSGFLARTTFSFDVANAQLAQILDQALQYGINRIDSITYKPTDALLKTAGDTAIRTAVADALAKADVLASALGRCRGDILRVIPRMDDIQSELGAFSSLLPVTPNLRQVTYYVTIQLLHTAC